MPYSYIISQQSATKARLRRARFLPPSKLGGTQRDTFMNELHRILKPGGKVTMLVHLSSYGALTSYEHRHYLSLLHKPPSVEIVARVPKAEPISCV